MKNSSLRLFAGASLLAVGLVTSAFANLITGSIAFNGTPNFDSSSLDTATGITSYNSSYVAFIQQTGDYSSVPNFTPVTFSAFTFLPATQSVNPLWSFTSAGKTYSARTTSMVSAFNPSLNIWNFGGTGVLSITGFDDTIADWNFSTGQIGQSFFFGSAAAALDRGPLVYVPESGATLGLLALALGAMATAFQLRSRAAGRSGRLMLA